MTPVALLRARVARSNIEPLVIQARNDRDIAIIELKRQLNIPVAQPVKLTSGIDSETLYASIARLVDTTLAPDRASLRSAELTLRAREEAVRASGLHAEPLGFAAVGVSGVPSSREGIPIETRRKLR